MFFFEPRNIGYHNNKKNPSFMNSSIQLQPFRIHPPSLTASPWKTMVGRLSPFLLGPGLFSGGETSREYLHPSLVQERPAGRAGRKEEPSAIHAAHVPGKKTVEGVALNQRLGET